jgi:hypothetical protein
MLELALIGGVVAIMAKIANYDDRSAILWGVITAVLCVASLLIPLPLARVLIAGLVAFVLMLVTKAIIGRG